MLHVVVGIVFPPEMQKTMDPIMRHTAHMKNLVFLLLVGQNRKMNQAGGDSHCIHLPHQGADPFFIPKDIGERRYRAVRLYDRGRLMGEKPESGKYKHRGRELHRRSSRLCRLKWGVSFSPGRLPGS